MSEAERKRRLAYKKNRRKWIIVQSVIIALVALVIAASTLVYYQLNKTYYIPYTEEGKVDYEVYLKDNDFFEQDYLGKDQAYVSALIEQIFADFHYDMVMGTSNVNFDYTYRIDAYLEILDADTDTPLFKPGYPLKEEQRVSQSSNHRLTIDEKVEIDYQYYNDLANEFIEVYGLSDTQSTLIVELNVNVIGNCDAFEQSSENEYSIALHIPLTGKTVNIATLSTVPSGESKVLACDNDGNQRVFLITSIVSSIIEAVLVVFLIVFMYLTRNEDINYAIRVKKLLSAYRSYIQQINNPFDMHGYQVLYVNTFTEMLNIRDTIQSPILMNENRDQTCTRFLIPTNTHILYIYELKVDDYDRIYAEYGEDEVPEEESEETAVTLAQETEVAEQVSEEAMANALAAPDVELEDIDYIDEIDEEYQGDTEHPGVEVVGVVWPEKPEKNKIYRYDPNGETLEDGDIVLVPTRTQATQEDIVRKAAVAHGNHTVDPKTLKYPLKKIIGVVKRKAQKALSDILS